MDQGVGITLGVEIGGSWEWVVVAEVEGRAVGDVKRAEYAIREWVSFCLALRAWSFPWEFQEI
jgi:hypothetical protein